MSTSRQAVRSLIDCVRLRQRGAHGRVSRYSLVKTICNWSRWALMRFSGGPEIVIKILVYNTGGFRSTQRPLHQQKAAGALSIPT